MNNYTVTVIMPVYNAADTVAEAIRSVMAQDFPREQMQVVVGDNGSNDGTPELIAAEFPDVEVATTTDRGCGYARNAALAKARGRYVCCTDADCVAEAGWVSALVDAFERAPDAIGCLGGRILPYRTTTAVERWRHVWIQPGFEAGTETLSYAATPNAAFRREVLARIGGFDGTLGFPDADMGVRLGAAGVGIQYVPEAVVRHRNAVSVSELYRHRVKYGVFMTRLARKHPGVFGAPDDRIAQGRLARQTARRVAGDLLYKFPRALVLGDAGHGTRLWPALDAVLAVANYVGVRRAAREVRP